MQTLPAELEKRLLYILHYGLGEIRGLALAAGNEQIADLADALEILPGMIDHWDEERLEMARYVLKTYQDKYPGRAFDYVAHVESMIRPSGSSVAEGDVAMSLCSGA